MAKLQIDGSVVRVRVSWFERLVLGDRPQTIALAQIRTVVARPKLPDMMLRWLGQRELWLSGVSAYEGQLIPATRHPNRTLCIETHGEPDEHVYVELDHDETDRAAAELLEAVEQLKNLVGLPAAAEAPSQSASR